MTQLVRQDEEPTAFRKIAERFIGDDDVAVQGLGQGFAADDAQFHGH